MSAKTHYLLSSGQVRGLYGCGFHWWTKNPGKVQDWRGRRFVHMRFQGIHNRMNTCVGFENARVHTALLGEDGYLRSLWRGGLEDAMEPAAVVLDVDTETRYDMGYRPHVERFRVGWTPYGSVAQAVDNPAEAEWRGHDELVRQLDWASYALEKSRKDLKTLIVHRRSSESYDEARRSSRAGTHVSLLLFEQWQWAALHATLYSLCVPFMNGAPE